MIAFQSIHQLREKLQGREVSATEMTEYFIQRIHRASPKLNCFISLDEEEALESAKLADRSVNRIKNKPLAGIPIAHKDLFCTNGTRTTCGSRMLESFVAPFEATIVRKLRNAGAICLGKTNMDEFAMGSSNETSYFGPSRNPWDTDRVPGGSSGGSAVAVAAGLVPACTGSDTGGSIRQPASFCGVTGLKPTYGRNSRYGMIAFASSLDQAGTLTRDVEDAALLLNIMEGYDEFDSTSVDMPLTQLLEDIPPQKIGYPTQLFRQLPQEIATCLEEVRRTLEHENHTFIDIELPHIGHAIAAYYVLSSAEASTNLSRYDGIRYGHRAVNVENLDELYTRSRSEGFGTEVKRRILTGTYVLSVGYYDAYYRKAQKIRRLIRQDYLNAFEDVDIILAPTTPSTAFRIKELNRDPTEMYLQDQFTVPVSLAGLPALTIPCGFVEGLPVGAQFVGSRFGESKLLSLGRHYQELTDWHSHHPPIENEKI